MVAGLFLSLYLVRLLELRWSSDASPASHSMLQVRPGRITPPRARDNRFKQYTTFPSAAPFHHHRHLRVSPTPQTPAARALVLRGLCTLACTPTLVALYIAASRAHDNWHFPSDIIAGSALGVPRARSHGTLLSASLTPPSAAPYFHQYLL